MKEILYIGCTEVGQTSFERLNAIRDLGYTVTVLNGCKPLNAMTLLWQKAAAVLGIVSDPLSLNKSIKEILGRKPVDIVWVDKGTRIRASTLKWIKQQWPACTLVHLNPDDPFGYFRKGWSVFLKAIPFYDIHFVARTQNLKEFAKLGATCVITYDRSFSKHLHRPISLTPEEKQKYNVQVGFIGSHAPARAAIISFLIENGIPVGVYGDGWDQQEHWATIKSHYRGRGRFGEEYANIINGMGNSFAFLAT
ncbi:MAG: hypothetical protein IPK76_25825 [Lewinellaceae bacterium]|nr:hypothetical protein [Lewinellaceae bacterium]